MSAGRTWAEILAEATAAMYYLPRTWPHHLTNSKRGMPMERRRTLRRRERRARKENRRKASRLAHDILRSYEQPDLPGLRAGETYLGAPRPRGVSEANDGMNREGLKTMWVAESRDAVESIERSVSKLIDVKSWDRLCDLWWRIHRRNEIRDWIRNARVVPSEQPGPTCPQEPKA